MSVSEAEKKREPKRKEESPHDRCAEPGQISDGIGELGHSPITTATAATANTMPAVESDQPLSKPNVSHRFTDPDGRLGDGAIPQSPVAPSIPTVSSMMMEKLI